MTSETPFVFFNGRVVPRRDAVLDIEDRGSLFADGVYEVVRYFNGRPLAMGQHVSRLKASLEAIDLSVSRMGAEAGGWVESLAGASDELVRRNGTPEASVYWQVTRGPAPRKHEFPGVVRPTVLAICYRQPAIDFASATPAAASVILAPDNRWRLCSIKSLMLLPNVLAKNRAVAAGADEAVFERGGTVIEGSSTNVMMVRGGEVWTYPADETILHGITRSLLLDMARHNGIAVHEKPYSTRDLFAADEAMLCGTTTIVSGIVKVDGKKIRGGAVGPVTERLYGMLLAHIAQECGVEAAVGGKRRG